MSHGWRLIDGDRTFEFPMRIEGSDLVPYVTSQIPWEKVATKRHKEALKWISDEVVKNNDAIRESSDTNARIQHSNQFGGLQFDRSKVQSLDSIRRTANDIRSCRRRMSKWKGHSTLRTSAVCSASCNMQPRRTSLREPPGDSTYRRCRLSC